MNQAIVEDLVTASHILAGRGVLDGLASLGESAVVLLRGHGNAVVGETLQQVVYRAIQTELNARLQLQAMMLDGLELFGAGRSGKGERPLRTRRHSNRSYLGALEGTKPATMIIPDELRTHSSEN